MTPSHSNLKRISVVGGGILALGAGIAIPVVVLSGSGMNDVARHTRPNAGSTTITTAATARITTRHRTKGPFAQLDQAVSQLALANVAFNVPTTLHRNDQAAIQLLLSGEQSIRALEKQLPALGIREGARIKVSPIMEADLTGLGFKIEANTKPIQPVAGRGVTTWEWTVEPTRAGIQPLHLTLSALISVNGHSSYYTVRVFDRTMNVTVTWSTEVTDFAGSNWQFLWTALLIPVGGLALRLRKARAAEKPRKKPAKKHDAKR